MTSVAELQQVLYRVDAAVLLVAPRILRRVIKLDRELPGIGLQVPHRKSYVLERVRLFRFVAPYELDVEPGVHCLLSSTAQTPSSQNQSR